MSNVEVHATAVIEAGAQLAEGVSVGPFCFVGRDVMVGAGSRLLSHVTLLGPTRLGERSVVYPYATLGAAPQDKTYTGESTMLVTGPDCVFREQVTVHRGTTKGGGITRLGANCLLMVGAHVAHDCQIADDVVLTNLTTLGGHVEVGRGAVCGGQVAVAPFVRLGRLSFVAGGARVERDVPPFTIAEGDRAKVRALNQVGLKRAQVPEASRRALKRAFKLIFVAPNTRAAGIRAVRTTCAEDPLVAELLEFLDGAPLTRLPASDLRQTHAGP